jgi:hypothetical protein
MTSVRTFLFAVAMLISGVSSAQYYYIPRGPKNVEVGISYASGVGDFKYRAQSYNEKTSNLVDTSFTKRITSKFGYGGSTGYYWNLFHLGPKSRLALTLTFQYNAFFWDGDVFDYSADKNNTVTTSIETSAGTVTAATIEEALPIGLDYKWGSDAMMNKSEKLCYSFGLGVYPSMDGTIYHGTSTMGFHARPYLKAEAGIFAGICMKLRLTYLMGGINYIDYEQNDPGNVEHTTFTSKGSTVLSLVFMPMSWKFGRYL